MFDTRPNGQCEQWYRKELLAQLHAKGKVPRVRPQCTSTYVRAAPQPSPHGCWPRLLVPCSTYLALEQDAGRVS